MIHTNEHELVQFIRMGKSSLFNCVKQNDVVFVQCEIHVLLILIVHMCVNHLQSTSIILWHTIAFLKVTMATLYLRAKSFMERYLVQSLITF